MPVRHDQRWWPALLWLVPLVGFAAHPTAALSERMFDRGEIDEGCYVSRAAYGIPHSAQDTIRLRSLFDRCAWELARRVGTPDALEAYLAGASDRSMWKATAGMLLCDVAPNYPGCDRSIPRPITAEELLRGAREVAASTPGAVAAATTEVGVWPDVDRRLQTGASHPLDVALVVGLEDYAFVSDVPYAARDARAVADWLIYTYGVPPLRVVTLTSGAVEGFRAEAQRVATMSQQGGTTWIYFAGHGAAHPETGSRLLLGDDLRADGPSMVSRGISVEDMLRLAQGSSSRVIAMLDTCFTGTARNGEMLIPGARFALPTEALQLKGIVEWAATGPGEIALPLEPVRHGAFTWLVLGALRGWSDGEITGVHDGIVTMDEATAFVNRNLIKLGLDGMNPAIAGPPELLSLPLTDTAPERAPSW